MAELFPFDEQALLPLCAELDSLRDPHDQQSTPPSTAPDAPCTPDRRGAELNGYREAIAYAYRQATAESFKWSPRFMLEVQRRVVAGQLGAGRFAIDGGADRHVHMGYGHVYQPPPQRGLPALTAHICRRLNDWDTHAALAAGWVHFATGIIHPFSDGNGRTARILAAAAMWNAGYRTDAFVSLERWWAENPFDKGFALLPGGAFEDLTAALTAEVEAGGSYNQAQLLERMGGLMPHRYDPRLDATHFMECHVKTLIRQVNQITDGAVEHDPRDALLGAR